MISQRTDVEEVLMVDALEIVNTKLDAMSELLVEIRENL
jgi:hypothetical protein